MLQFGLSVLISSIVNVYGYSSGAPSTVCTAKMQPLHKVYPQGPDPPYNLSVTAVQSGNRFNYKVTIEPTTNKNFEGFIVKARLWGYEANEYIGEFLTPPDGTKYGSCGTGKQTVTHTSDAAKQSISLTWVPPVEYCNKKIEFQATVLEVFYTFWTLVLSESFPVVCEIPTTTSTTTSTSTTPSTSTETLTNATMVPNQFDVTTVSQASNIFQSRWVFYLHILMSIILVPFL